MRVVGGGVVVGGGIGGGAVACVGHTGPPMEPKIPIQHHVAEGQKRFFLSLAVSVQGATQNMVARQRQRHGHLFSKKQRGFVVAAVGGARGGAVVGVGVRVSRVSRVSGVSVRVSRMGGLGGIGLPPWWFLPWLWRPPLLPSLLLPPLLLPPLLLLPLLPLQRGFALPVGHRAARVGGTFFLVAAVGQRWANGREQSDIEG